jgi:hypothetical protein
VTLGQQVATRLAVGYTRPPKVSGISFVGIYRMSVSIFDLVFTLNRCAHIVATTILVGGVLFFRFVVPQATAHLKDEQQLAVFGQARWLFRRIAWISALALVLSGLISLWRVWPVYMK